MDARLYLEVNHFAQKTASLHGFMHAYASYLGLIAIALLLIVSLLRSLREEDVLGKRKELMGLASVVLGAGVSAGVAEVLSHLIGRMPPYLAIHGVEVLVGRNSAPSMPSLESALIGAVVIGLFATRAFVLGGIATLLGVLYCYDLVYVGANYPGDVLAGAGLGIVVVLLAMALLYRLSGAMSLGLDTLPGRAAGAPAPIGPASSPSVLGSTGSVRLLSEAPLKPQRVRDLEGAREAGVRSS